MIVNPILFDISEVKTLQADTSDNEGAWEEIINIKSDILKSFTEIFILLEADTIAGGGLGAGPGTELTDGTLEARTQFLTDPVLALGSGHSQTWNSLLHIQHDKSTAGTENLLPP